MRTSTAYGALSAVMKDNLYWFGSRGFIFTSPWVVTPSTVRHAAVVLLTASGEPVEVTAGNSVVRRDAVAIAPLTPRGLRAMDVGLISLQAAGLNPDGTPDTSAADQTVRRGVHPWPADGSVRREGSTTAACPPP